MHRPARARMRALDIQVTNASCAPRSSSQEMLIWTDVERSPTSFRQVSATRAHAEGYDAIPPHA